MMHETIRNILEALGVVESRQTLVKRKLSLASQTKPSGPVTLVVSSLGSKPVSAISAVRQLTRLNLEEISTLSGMLPWPLLRNVSPEIAMEAQKLLEVMGVEVELTGMPLGDDESDSPAELPTKSHASVTLPAGNHVVVLTQMGLLEERVIEGICKITGAGLEEATLMTRHLPRPILIGVDEETAYRAQQELQMVAAVVEVEEVAEDEPEMGSPDEAPLESNAGLTDGAENEQHQRFSLWLIEAGPYRTPLLYKLSELTGMKTAQIEGLLEKLPGLLLSELEWDQAESFQQSLNSIGAVTELVLSGQESGVPG